MLNTTKELINEVEELKTEIISKCGTEILEEMDELELGMVKRMFKLMSASEDVMLKQAEMLDDINKKLDKLLKKEES